MKFSLFMAKSGPFLAQRLALGLRQFVRFVEISLGQVAVETSKLNANDALFFGCRFLWSLKRQ